MAEEEREFQDVIRDHSQDNHRKAPVPIPSGAAAISRYAVMIRIKIGERWIWTTWMCFDTYPEAAAHAREYNKVVRFGSPEWAALRQQSETASPTIITAPQERLRPRGKDETLVEFVLRFLSARGFSEEDEGILSEVKHGSISQVGGPDLGNQEYDTAVLETLGKTVTETSTHIVDLLPRTARGRGSSDSCKQCRPILDVSTRK